MTTNPRPDAENELQYLLKRCDEVFGELAALIKTRDGNLETFRALQTEGSELAQRLSAAIRHKRNGSPARPHRRFIQNAQPE